MIFHLLLILILIGIVADVSRKANDWVPLTRFHHLIIPAYSLIMFVLTFKPDAGEGWVFFILLLAAILIGWYQTSGIEVAKKYDKKKKTYRWMVKRNKQYIIGWIVLFVAGIALNAWFSHEQIFSLLGDKVWEEILDEIDPLAVFTEKHGWYIWLLSGVSSSIFTWLSTIRIKKESAAIKAKGLTPEEVGKTK